MFVGVRVASHLFRPIVAIFHRAHLRVDQALAVGGGHRLAMQNIATLTRNHQLESIEPALWLSMEAISNDTETIVSIALIIATTNFTKDKQLAKVVLRDLRPNRVVVFGPEAELRRPVGTSPWLTGLVTLASASWMLKFNFAELNP